MSTRCLRLVYIGYNETGVGQAVKPERSANEKGVHEPPRRWDRTPMDHRGLRLLDRIPAPPPEWPDPAALGAAGEAPGAYRRLAQPPARPIASPPNLTPLRSRDRRARASV